VSSSQTFPKPPVTEPPASPVHAEFSVTDSVGLAPLKVTFTDQSAGPVTSWLWDFGDGTTSAATSPIHIFQNPGVYDITLSVEGQGSSDSTKKTGAVQVIAPVVSAFIASPCEGTTPLEVRFEEQSTGTILKREWSFGDGIYSELENPVHVYEKPGTYDVSLKVTGTHNEDLLTRPSYILVHPDLPPPTKLPTPDPTPFIPVPEPVLPKAVDEAIPVLTESKNINPEPVSSPIEPTKSVPEIEEVSPSEPEKPVSVPPVVDFILSPDSGTAPLTIQCTDTSTGVFESIFWDFGDGSNTSETNPIHVYEIPGEYTITLTRSSPGYPEEFTKSAVIRVQAPPEPPVAQFTISSTEGTAPFAIACTDQSEGDITERIWDFGDGKVIRGKNPTHTYVLPGQYSITLTVRGPGGKDELRKNSVITVLPSPEKLTALFSADPVRGNAPLSVIFHDSSTGIISAWDWDFGDGTVSHEQNPTHVYSQPGTYSVKLVVTGPDGSSEKFDENLIVVDTPVEPVRAAFSVYPISGDAPLTISCTDKTMGDADTWNWSFGDGGFSSEKNPNHTYNQPGIYTVSLEACGPGGKDSVVKNDLISVLGSGISPELIITAEPAHGTAPLTVTFEKTNVPHAVSTLWDFGEGNTSNEENPVHTYVIPGVYNVSLTVQDSFGQTRTVTKNEFINVTQPIPPPVAKFISNSTHGYVPCTIRFTDQSQGEITQWNWSFGDGNEAHSQDIIHIYNTTGSFYVSLKVSGPGGEDTNVAPQPVIVEEIIPTPAPVIVNESPVPTGQPQLEEIIENRNISPPTTINNTAPTLVTPEITQKKPVLTESVANISLQGTEPDYEGPVKEPSPVRSDTISRISPELAHQEMADTQIHAKPRTIPEIFVTNKSGPAPLMVQFSSTWSEENGTYLWNFGDGTTSNESKVIHTFEKPGNYTIHLTRVYDGNTQEIINNNLICVTEPESIPFASFTADPVTGPVPLHVIFQSESNGTISEWSWDFGDSSTGIGETVTHTYTKPGTYSVSLMVRGPDGTSVERREDLITVGTSLTPPQARFRTDKRTGYAPLTVQFTDQSLGKVTDWTWDFGDGSSATEKNPVHVFNETGVFSVSLTVSGPNGINQVSRKGYIVVTKPPEPLIAGFTLKPSEGIAPLSVQCTDTSSGTVNRYLWDFGDGAVSESRHPSHRYTSPGSYIIKLTVYGPAGVSSADQMVTVGPVLTKPSRINTYPYYYKFSSKEQNPSANFDSEISNITKPFADFVISKKSGRAPLSVICEDRSTGTIESWSWDFGDGTHSIEQNPTHIYTKPGTYTISLTVKSSYGVSNKKLRDAINVF
ncbi:MAG TPA: PKD domain-containing protein, partial [Methanospirillum sp.]|uniref:PKD domain-containing protein n=1 Tax=Methanospirillum sp. TaxID=45200 RepID=UPI002D059250